MLHNQCQFGWNQAVTKDHLLLRPKELFVPLSPLIAAVWLKHHTWQPLSMCDDQCKLRRNRIVTKGTFLFRSELFSCLSRLA
jgi:hypothetical protein